MLLQRVITAAILVPLVILAVFQLSGDYFSLTFGLVILIAAWEWSYLIGIDKPSKRYLFLAGLIVAMLWIQFWTQFLEGLQYVIETGQQDLYQHAKKVGWTSISTFMEYLNVPDVRIYSGALEWLVVPPVIFWVLIMAVIKHTPTGVLKLELTPKQRVWLGWFVLLAAWMFLVRLRVLYGPEMTMLLFDPDLGRRYFCLFCGQNVG